MSTLLQRAFEKFCGLILTKYCTLKTTPTKLPEGPFIVCANHSSHADTPVLMLALNRSFDDFNMLAAKDHFQPDPRKKGLAQYLMNLILVDRKANPIEIRRLLKECEEAKAQNKILIIYPEGTRSPEGQLRPFKSGTVYLAYKLKLPIIPAAIIGTGKALPKGHWFVRPYSLEVRFGEPIQTLELEGQTQKQALHQLTLQVQKAIQDLLFAPSKPFS